MSLQSPRSIPPPLPSSHNSSNAYQEHLTHTHPIEENLPVCVRCKEPITSGHAYELGDDRWHTHCFSCYRCEKSLSCDSDFLVLGTGALICFDCSDSCKKCGKKIDDLAIILSSSNEAYCSDCFVCCKCGDNIKDLKYARTRKGLFCLKCHKKLLAKRKYYEEKKRREKKNLPMPPELNNPEMAISENINDFNLDSPIPEIQESSPAKSVTSAVRKISMHSPLPNGGDYPKSPKPKYLLDKTPLKNFEGDKQLNLASPSWKDHRKDLSLPLFDQPRQHDSTLESPRHIERYTSKSHIKSRSDLTDSIRQSHLIDNDKDMFNENTFTKTPRQFLNIPSTTTTPFNDLSQQPTTPKRVHNENMTVQTIDETHTTHAMLETSKYEGQDNTENVIGNDNTTMSEDNDILNSYMDKSSQLDINDSSALISQTNVDIKIANSQLILKKLQDDITTLQTSKSELLQTMEDMLLMKKDLESQLMNLKNEINASKQILVDQTQQPHFVIDSIESSSGGSSPVKNISTVSVARPATKPKFWKFFSSKPQSGSTTPLSSMKSSTSNQNIPSLKNTQPPIMFTTSGSRSSSPRAAMTSSTQRLEISNPTVQNPEDFKDMNLLPLSNHNNGTLPTILTECIQFIESDEENLKSEGLYRKSGSKRVIEEIEAQFSNGAHDIDLTYYDINAVTGVLKRYLRNLPNPVITYEIYEPIIAYVRINHMNLSSNETKQGFINILRSLPREHVEVLKLLGRHINLVQQYSDVNLMTSKNLCLVFTPSLLRDYSGEKDIIDLKERNFVISYILEHYAELFN